MRNEIANKRTEAMQMEIVVVFNILWRGFLCFIDGRYYI